MPTANLIFCDLYSIPLIPANRFFDLLRFCLNYSIKHSRLFLPEFKPLTLCLLNQRSNPKATIAPLYFLQIDVLLFPITDLFQASNTHDYVFEASNASDLRSWLGHIRQCMPEENLRLVRRCLSFSQGSACVILFLDCGGGCSVHILKICSMELSVVTDFSIQIIPHV